MNGQQIYDRIGGEASINAAVDLFYTKVLADTVVAHFFQSVDMKKQSHAQKTFLTMALGGPNNYTGKDMREAHKHLKLTEEHFDHIVAHLVESLKELNVSDELINEIAQAVLPLKEDILNQ